LALGIVLDNLGGYFNTEVQKEYTASYIKLAGEKLGEAGEFLAELVSSPVFVLSEVDREKKLCRSDIEARKKNPELAAMDEFLKIAYGGSSLGYSGIADETFLESLKRDDLVSAHQKYYSGSNMTLVIVGKESDYSSNIDRIKAAFEKIGAGEKTSFTPFDKTKIKPEAKRIEFETPNVYITFGYPSLARYDKDRRVLDFIEALLSRGRANERLLPIYLKRTPALALRTTSQTFSDYGTFILALLAVKTTVRMAYQQTIEQLEMIKNRLVDEREIKRMKNWYTGNLMIQTVDPVEYGFFHGLSYIFNEGKVEGYEAVREKILAITADDIQRVAKEVFNQEKLSVVMVGKDLDQIS